MTPIRPASSRSWRAPAVALALALGAALGGCGPSKQFCADAIDNGYVCVPPSDAGPQMSDAFDGPLEERGTIVVGDDETAGADGGATTD
jgi:hypothetical protein